MKRKVVFNDSERAILKKVAAFGRKEKASLFLVGGALRDKLLERQRKNPDIDFCVAKNAIAFGRKLAPVLKAGFVVLDQEHGACRLIHKAGEAVYTLDFTDFRGRSLEEDLLLRDFTINSLAMRIEDALANDAGLALIDPCDGQKDIKRRLLRSAYKESFKDDPLRVLRAFSFACTLDFKIEEKTLLRARALRKGLLKVSGERIRDELFKILECPDAAQALGSMDKHKILETVIPEINLMRGVYQGPYHHLDIWKHTLESVRQFDKISRDLSRRKELCAYLGQVLAGGRTRRALIRLALLLHDIGKPRTKRRKKGKISFYGHERAGLSFCEEICRRLKLSNEEVRSVKTMVLWHLRPGYLGDLDQISLRARFRYFRDTGGEAVAVALLSMGDQRATRGPLTTLASVRQHERTALSLVREYFREKKEEKPCRLVNGDDVMAACGLAPSPLVGRILKELDELQAIGKLKNRHEALAAAARLAREHNQKSFQK